MRVHEVKMSGEGMNINIGIGKTADCSGSVKRQVNRREYIIPNQILLSLCLQLVSQLPRQK